MDVNEDLAWRVRAVLARKGELQEVRMFGGLCFMLNGNMVAGTSKRGLLVRVGKEQQAAACGRTRARWKCRAGRWRAMSSSTRRRRRTECCASGSNWLSLSSGPCGQTRRNRGRGGSAASNEPGPASADLPGLKRRVVTLDYLFQAVRLRADGMEH